MYYIAICDDDLNYIDYLEKILRLRVGLSADEVIFCKYSSGEELVNDLEQNIPFHLLILDMQMKALDGDDTAKKFRQKYPDTLLVFCSGVCRPTVKSFEANAYRYLLKEYDSDRMTMELGNVIREMKQRAAIPEISLTYRNEIKSVRMSDIVYVSIRKHGCEVYVFDRERRYAEMFISNKSIKETYDELESFSFVYAHNSYFINLSYVVNIANHEVTLRDGTVLAVSRSREKQFKEALGMYLSNRY